MQFYYFERRLVKSIIIWKYNLLEEKIFYLFLTLIRIKFYDNSSHNDLSTSLVY